MATFFHGGAPEIQPDGLQTLYLMNPGYVGYPSDGSATSNMLLLNQAGVSASSQSAHQHQLLGIPLQNQVSASSSSVDHSRPMSISVPHDISAVHGSLPRVHYNLWNPTTNSGIDAAAQQLRRPSMAPLAQQGLSLSLSPQQANYGPYRQDREMLVSPSSTSEATNGMPGLQGMLMGSKYLKAAQQLLDEVVNVGKGIKDDSPRVSKNLMKASRDADEAAGEETGLKRAAELTTVERQELQMKKAKLANMLDEVRQPMLDIILL